MNSLPSPSLLFPSKPQDLIKPQPTNTLPRSRDINTHPISLLRTHRLADFPAIYPITRRLTDEFEVGGRSGVDAGADAAGLWGGDGEGGFEGCWGVGGEELNH